MEDQEPISKTTSLDSKSEGNVQNNQKQDPNSEKGFDSESIASKSTWAKLKREIHLLKNEQKKRDEEQAKKNHWKTVKSLCSCVFFIIAGFTIFTLIIVLDAKNAGNQSFITKSFPFLYIFCF